MIVISFLVIYTMSYTAYSHDSLYRASVACGSATDISVVSFSLYDRRDNLLYSVHGLDVRAVYVSEHGSVFTVSDTCLYMYAVDGTLTNLGELDCPNMFGFSPGDFLFFSSDRDGITAYSNQGNVVYALRPGRLFASTERGELIAIVAVDTVFIYEHGIETLRKVLATPYARDIVFTDDRLSIIIEEPTGTETVRVPGTVREEQ
jgi:hypothetical protein